MNGLSIIEWEMLQCIVPMANSPMGLPCYSNQDWTLMGNKFALTSSLFIEVVKSK